MILLKVFLDINICIYVFLTLHGDEETLASRRSSEPILLSATRISTVYFVDSSERDTKIALKNLVSSDEPYFNFVLCLGADRLGSGWKKVDEQGGRRRD